MGFYPRYKIITIFTDIVKVISDFGLRILDSGFWMLVGGPLFGRQRRLPYWILTPGSLLLAFYSMPYAFFNRHCDCVCDQGQASVDEYGSLLYVRADGCGRWRAALPGTSDRDGHRHAYASAHAR